MPSSVAVQLMNMGVGGMKPDGTSCCMSGKGGRDGQSSGTFNDVFSAILAGLEKGLGDLQHGMVVDAEGKTITLDELLQKLFNKEGGESGQPGTDLDMLQQLIAQLQLAGSQPVVLVGNAHNIMKSFEGGDGSGEPGDRDNVVMKLMTVSESGMQKVSLHTDGESFVQFKAMMRSDMQQPVQQANAPFNNTGDADTQEVVTVMGNVSDTKSVPVSPAVEGTAAEGFSTPAGKNEGAIEMGKGPTIALSGEQARRNDDFAVNRKERGHEEASAAYFNKTIRVESVKIAPDAPESRVEDSPDIAASQNGDPTVTAPAVQVHQTPYAKEGGIIKETVHVSRLNEVGEPIMKTLGSGDKHMIIKIEPPDLGSIQIKLRMENGVLKADFRVDSPIVKDLFSMAIPHIRETIENSGIKAGEFLVDVKDEYYSDGREKRESAEQQQQQQKQNKEPRFQFFDYFA